MGKSSKKRERTDEDVADNHDAKPVVKKSKLDSTGKAEVTKKSSKVKEPKPEPVVTEDAPEEAPKAKKEKKDKKDRKEKKDKKEKKEKKSKSKEDTAATPKSDEPTPAAALSEAEPAEAKEAATNGTNGTNGVDSTDKKSKKKSKKDKKKKSSKTDDTPTNGEATNGEANGETNGDDTNETTTTNGKPNRFICFVGNLPYSATVESVRAHFATLQPTSVRLLTQRDDPSKSRGIAFVEFAGYDHMKTCLKKFHHTEFEEPGAKGPPRRINVELTAGGGGKTAARQDKIKQKNAKLNEERANRMQREEEAKLEKAATGGGGGGKTQEQRDEDSIHPSRRARVPYGKN